MASEKRTHKMSVVNTENGETGKVEANRNVMTSGQTANTTVFEAHIGTNVNHFHQYHHAAPQDEPTQSEKSQEQKESGSDEKVWIQISNNIRIFKENPISKRARVYRGEIHSEITGTQKLAVKLIEYEEKNIKEAKMLVKLKLHHNVVDILSSGFYLAGPIKFMYIAMELCHEQNLHQLIEESKANGDPFDPVAMNSYVEQVIEGLKFIHEHKILHRDLKLDNLLLSLDRVFLKICDFGLSKELKLDRSVTQQSQIGTIGYMAPETFNNNEVSKMSDIFSLGIVIYALWSYGLHPFGNDPDDWNANIKRFRNRDLSQILVPNKKDATDLLEKILQFEPRQRPTAEQIQKHEYFTRKDEETKVGNIVQQSGYATVDASDVQAAGIVGIRARLRTSLEEKIFVFLKV